ncbi:DinB family protein [Kitasatospora camelliae]|uniref:DinB family protein n=1 Tax=Kitasatospora camelliae TaxID=3156397 RepID=A0AAU8JVG5_9ACTN
MPTLVDAVSNERDALLAFLEAQRGGLRRAASGLTEEQAASTPSASSLSLAVLVRHAARGEQWWVEQLLGGPAASAPANWADEYRMPEGETLAQWLVRYEEVAAATEKVIRDLPSLDVDFPLPEAPWFSPNSRRSARWMLLHLIEEVARHAGHADVIRESLDGKTAFELLYQAQES